MKSIVGGLNVLKRRYEVGLPASKNIELLVSKHCNTWCSTCKVKHTINLL
jgi:hypothetical protein